MTLPVLVLGLFLAALAAVIPTVLWTMIVWWCDRFEREPIPLLLATFLWGALPAAVVALLAELWFAGWSAPSGQSLVSEVLSASAVAPVVEECAKAGALLLLLLFWPDEIDDALDGLLYGALVGFGFAMTENFLYFAGIVVGGDWSQLGTLVVLRGVVFGLNHAFFSAFFGSSLGYAHTLAGHRSRYGLPLLGLGAAILAHAIHNLGTSLVAITPAGLALSLTSDIGGVLVTAVLIALFLGQERRWLRVELASEVGRLFTADEYEVLLSARGRWGMLARARRSGGWRAVRLAGEFQQRASELAFYKHRVGRRGPDARAERRLLELSGRVLAARSQLGLPALA